MDVYICTYYIYVYDKRNAKNTNAGMMREKKSVLCAYFFLVRFVCL